MNRVEKIKEYFKNREDVVNVWANEYNVQATVESNFVGKGHLITISLHDNKVSKVKVPHNFLRFTNEELKFFDSMGLEIDDHDYKVNHQNIRDWFWEGD